MRMKTKVFWVKLHPPASKCDCGNAPCTRNRITAKLSRVKGGKMGWKPMKQRRLCEDCYNKAIAEISQNSLRRWHDGYEEKE